jgi:cellulose synthase operon protein C
VITDGPTPEEIEAFVAGELADADADRVRDAIVRDPRVAAEVEECLQLRAAVAEMPAGAADAPVDQIAARRRRQRTMIAAGVAVAAAAGVIGWLVMRPARGTERVATAAVVDDVRGALAPRRGLEPRLSWQAVDGHRPYDVARAGGTAGGEALSFDVLARVEALRDPTALFAAQLVVGNLDQAARVLDAAPATAAVASDRAALALVRRDPELAIVHAAAALAQAPDHVQARWNRAIALGELGLDRSAAAELDAIAARGEPGWADEARTRAAALRAQRERRDAASAGADQAGAAFVAGGEPPIALVAEFPDRMRLFFYDAVRTAPTAERVAALRPIAAALDQQFAETSLAALVDRVAAADFKRRAPLAARYAEVRATRDPAAAAALVAAAGKARADDIALGALLFTGTTPGLVAPALLDRYRGLAEGGTDPWFQLAAIEQRASLLFQADDVSTAESILAAGLERCGASRIVLRCQRIQRLLVHAYKVLHRFAAARRMLDDVLRSARATSSVQLEGDLLQYAGAIALWRDDVGASWVPVGDAYLEEWARVAGTCLADRVVRETRASALINRHRNDEARAVFAGEPACPDAKPTVSRLFVLAHLTAGDPPRLAVVRADITALRGDPSLDATDRAFLDHVEGRALLDSDAAAARVLLRQAAASAATGPTAAQARAYSYAALIDDAGARGAWREAIDLFAQELGDDRAAPCTLGASVDREETYVAVGAGGDPTGSRGPALRDGGQGPVPAPVVAALAGCDQVTVIGRGAYHGRPKALPADWSWSYRSHRGRAGAGPAIDRSGPTLIVTGAQPPARMLLPPLAPLGGDLGGARVIEGAAATPDRVLAGMLDASYVELHAHGVLDAEGSSASFIALSPDAGGRFTLTAEAVAAATMRRRPVVILAACHAAVSGTTHHTTGGLADAFIAAGARAVIASPEPIADADAGKFFAALRARIASGTLPSQALRDERAAWTDPRARSWIDALVVVESTNGG